jgi:ureidoglycolate lyase
MTYPCGGTEQIVVQPLTADLFAPFGEIVEATGPARMINEGLCARYHDLATLDFGKDGHAGISVFHAEPRELPLDLKMVERHPFGSQAFLPMSAEPFLVIVAPDEAGVPGRPLAFMTAPGQGVNYRRGIWHGVLTPLDREATFAVVDRIGLGENLEEHWFPKPWRIRR